MKNEIDRSLNIEPLNDSGDGTFLENVRNIQFIHRHKDRRHIGDDGLSQFIGQRVIAGHESHHQVNFLPGIFLGQVILKIKGVAGIRSLTRIQTLGKKFKLVRALRQQFMPHRLFHQDVSGQITRLAENHEDFFRAGFCIRILRRRILDQADGRQKKAGQPNNPVWLPGKSRKEMFQIDQRKPA
jgi:hypothetical protein